MLHRGGSGVGSTLVECFLQLNDVLHVDLVICPRFTADCARLGRNASKFDVNETFERENRFVLGLSLFNRGRICKTFRIQDTSPMGNSLVRKRTPDVFKSNVFGFDDFDE